MRYPGGKGKCYQHVINLMPPHSVYIETHLGGGSVLRHKRPAKRNIAIEVSLRYDWEEIKDSIMLQCLIEKFFNEKLANLLLDTSNSELIEGNWWNNTYWGVCKGKGLNKLGIMLMNIRNHLKGK